MVTIAFYIDGYHIKNHANYASKGSDIVCAAISGICFGAINWFKQEDVLKYRANQKIPELVIKVKQTQNNLIALSVIKSQVATICKDYSDFCELKIYQKELE
ncbi:MAG: ribosomal-processing cysteine protease Prp [Malacoplasma sp.]|nr:ribosomal-processing cysteine protease Prp [Malacoplasma sp.]